MANVVELVHSGGQFDEFAPCVEIVDGLMLRHDADLSIKTRISTDRATKHRDAAAGGCREAGHHV